MPIRIALLLSLIFPLSAVYGQGPPLGPKDTAKYPPTDTSRVAAGTEACTLM